jgi:hypothetical protein
MTSRVRFPGEFVVGTPIFVDHQTSKLIGTIVGHETDENGKIYSIAEVETVTVDKIRVSQRVPESLKPSFSQALSSSLGNPREVSLKRSASVRDEGQDTSD